MTRLTPFRRLAPLPRTGSATRPCSCRNRPRRCYGSGLATGEDILLDDRVDAPISINQLGEVRSDRINHRGLLADEQVACAVKHQAALLLRRLCWHEPHVGSGDRLANRLCVSCIVLLTLNVGLYIGWWHQSDGMAECLKFARPIVGRGASLDADQAWWQLLKERQDGATLQLAADDHLASRINSVNLQNRLGEVETDGLDRLHG